MADYKLRPYTTSHSEAWPPTDGGGSDMPEGFKIYTVDDICACAKVPDMGKQVQTIIIEDADAPGDEMIYVSDANTQSFDGMMYIPGFPFVKPKYVMSMNFAQLTGAQALRFVIRRNDSGKRTQGQFPSDGFITAKFPT